MKSTILIGIFGMALSTGCAENTNGMLTRENLPSVNTPFTDEHDPTRETAPALACIGQPDVAGETPFLLTFRNLTVDQLEIVTDELNRDGLLRAESIFSVDDLQILSLAVLNSSATDEDILSRVGEVTQKQEIPSGSWFLECNGILSPDDAN